jgi:hypothetical protein
MKDTKDARFAFRARLIVLAFSLMLLFTPSFSRGENEVKKSPADTQNDNAPGMITKVEVWAIDWDIIFSVALGCDEIKTWNNVYNRTITDKEKLSIVNVQRSKLKMKAHRIDACNLDVRVRFDVFFSDERVSVMCFETPYIFSIDGCCYWDTDNITAEFSNILPEGLGSEFSKDRSELLFDYANKEIKLKN